MAYGVTASSMLLAGGTSSAVASASVHLAEVGTTFVSGISHWRLGNVRWHTVRWLAVPGGIGAFAGATILSGVDGSVLKPWIAGLLCALGCYILVRFAFGATRRPLSEARIRGRFLAPLGLVGGFVDAIGGGGWGPITTPALMTVGRMEPRRAIGSVSASEFVVSLAASIGFLTHLGGQAIDKRIVLGLLMGGVAVAPFAAWLVRKVEAQVLGSAVGVLLIVVNVRTLMSSAPVRTKVFVISALVIAGVLLVARVARQSSRRRAIDSKISDDSLVQPDADVTISTPASGRLGS